MKKQEIKILDDGRIMESTKSTSGILTQRFYSLKQFTEVNKRRIKQQNVFDAIQIIGFFALTFFFIWFFNQYTPLINYVFHG